LPALVRFYARRSRRAAMTFGIAHLQPIVSLLAGILILIMPRLLNFIVAIYLIVIGIIGLGLFR
jgi:predicted Co/Zn/Cd cation transporter (cation efflux family)